MKFRFVSTVLTAGLIVVSGCNSSSIVQNPGNSVQSDELATFDGYSLDRMEFEERYTRTSGEKKAAVAQPMSEYVDFLERYVNFRLKVTDAIEKGLGDDPELQSELKDYRDQLARPYLVEQEVIDSLVLDVYNKQQEQIRASHILVRLEENADSATVQAASDKAQSLVDSLKSGLAFADVAFKYSEDPSAKRNQGDLGYFTGGRMILAFEEMAYRTPVGESSEPFRTRFGYHILNVTDRMPAQPEIRASHILIRTNGPDTTEAFASAQELLGRIQAGEDFAELATQYSEDTGSGKNGGDLNFFPKDRMVPAPTYDEAYDDVKKIVKRLPRAAQREEELGSKFRMEAGSTVDASSISNLVAGLSGDELVKHLQSGSFGESVTESAIGTIGATSFTSGQFTEWLRALRPVPQIKTRAQLETEVDRFLNVKAIDVASNSLEDRNTEFRELMNEYRDGIILFRVMEDSVWNKATADSAGQLAFYEDRKASYQFPERKRVLSYYSAKDSLLKIIDTAIKSGEPIDVSYYSEEDSIFKVDTTFVSDSTNSIYDRALPLAPGNSSEISAYRRGHILLYVDGLEAPRQKSFSEARAEVITGYQDQLEKEWVAKLRARYNAEVYPERLKGIFPRAKAAE